LGDQGSGAERHGAGDAEAPPQIELRVHGDFVEWLAGSAGTIAVTTYNAGKLALFSAPRGELESRFIRLPRPMGLAFDGIHLAVGVRDQLQLWRATAEAPLELAAAHVTGRLNVHDVSYDARGLCFVNTRFNCLARPSERASFRRVWQPWFITEPQRRDCCHLNGVGVRDGRVAMATAFCTAAEPGGWRSGDRFSTGVVIDVRRNRAAVVGLCMPHSPRWDGRHWWLCNSGAGTLCKFDPERGVCETVATLPGFTRGLCFAAGRAVVGLSRIRRRHILDAPPVRRQFPVMRSGLWLVDPATGRTTGALEFARGGRETYDVAFLAGFGATARQSPT
jgi:uncharacterized protein (TIGR03032 family)